MLLKSLCARFDSGNRWSAYRAAALNDIDDDHRCATVAADEGGTRGSIGIGAFQRKVTPRSSNASGRWISFRIRSMCHVAQDQCSDAGGEVRLGLRPQRIAIKDRRRARRWYRDAVGWSRIHCSFCSLYRRKPPWRRDLRNRMTHPIRYARTSQDADRKGCYG
jgi:hypothetical protein